MEFRRDIKLEASWEAGREGKVEVREGKKINSLRAKSTGVSLGQRNWEEVTRCWLQVG